MTFADHLTIWHAHQYEEWLELHTDEYSDWWQFDKNDQLGMFASGAD